MSKIDSLAELRAHIENWLLPNVNNIHILINTEENHLSAIYDGRRMCKIYRSGELAIRLEFEEGFYNDEESIPKTLWCYIENLNGFVFHISNSIRYYNKKKGQKSMVIADLKRYLFNRIGNEFIIDYDPGIKGTYRVRDRLRIRYDCRCVCSIYDFEGDPERFTVIYYEPFIHRSEGYSSTVTLKVDEIIMSIKNRTIIYNNKKDDGKFKVNDPDSMVDKVLSQCKGGFTYAHSDGRDFRHMYPSVKVSMTVSSFIKDVIFNDPATIVFWFDDTKTVVKCQPGETFDPEKGLAMAISKKVLGNDYGYYETFAKYVGRYNKKHKEK